MSMFGLWARSLAQRRVKGIAGVHGTQGARRVKAKTVGSASQAPAAAAASAAAGSATGAGAAAAKAPRPVFPSAGKAGQAVAAAPPFAVAKADGTPLSNTKKLMNYLEKFGPATRQKIWKDLYPFPNMLRSRTHLSTLLANLKRSGRLITRTDPDPIHRKGMFVYQLKTYRTPRPTKTAEAPAAAAAPAEAATAQV